MNDNKTLVPFVRTLDEMERVAMACAKSGYYRDVREASQALVKMLAGAELGIGPVESLSSIFIVENRPAISTNLMAARVKASGKYNYRVLESTNERCRIDWYERTERQEVGKDDRLHVLATWERVGESAFDLEDAKRAGLAGKGNWSKYPRAMLFNRALSEGARKYAPDALHGGIYTVEELAPDVAVSEEGIPLVPTLPAVAASLPEPAAREDSRAPATAPLPEVTFKEDEVPFEEERPKRRGRPPKSAPKEAPLPPPASSPQEVAALWANAKAVAKRRGWTEAELEERMRSHLADMFALESTRSLTSAQIRELSAVVVKWGITQPIEPHEVPL